MGPKAPVAQTSELFRLPLCDMLNAKHPLVKLADVVDWEEIERSFGTHFQATTHPRICWRHLAGQRLVHVGKKRVVHGIFSIDML